MLRSFAMAALTLAAIVHALAARAWAATAPKPAALPPAAITRSESLDALTVAELRRWAAHLGHPRRLYTYGRRAELLAALGA
jgi:hypothetical protein